jgi:hypothetical protein
VDFSDGAIYEDIKTQLNGLDIGILGNQCFVYYAFNQTITPTQSTGEFQVHLSKRRTFTNGFYSKQCWHTL